VKWLFLFALIALIGPLSSWLRTNRKHAPKVWFILGALPFIIDPFNLAVAPISWPHWPGHARGLEISLLDAVALAIIFSGRSKYRTPFVWLFVFYIATALFSVLQANVRMGSMFFVWQTVRILIVFAAVVRVCEDERAPFAILKGMIAGLVVHAGYSIKDAAGGDIQASGAFLHQNLLGITTHFVAMPALAILMATKRAWWPITGTIAALISTILTASRATIGLVGGGFALVLAFSVMRKMTPRKGAMALLGFVALIVAAPIAMMSLERRYDVSGRPDLYGDERALFETAATSIIRDYPLGVGASQYVIVANTQGYSSRAGVGWHSNARSAHVHNSYLLIAAEQSLLGLVAFVMLFARGMVIAFKCAFRFPKDPRGDLMLGLGTALAMVAIHAFYEWVLLVAASQYLLAINLGLIAGLARQMGYWRRKRPMRINAVSEEHAAVGSIPAAPDPQLRGNALR
jgi:O-antigen ligase